MAMTAQIIEFRREPCEGNHQEAAVKALLADRETSMLLARAYAQRAEENLADNNVKRAAICIKQVRFLLEGGKL